MSKIIKRTTPLSLILIAILIGGGLIIWQSAIKASDVGTSVTVANAAPGWVYVYESPASNGTNPTDAGDNVTFKAKADDPNNDSWYLLICKGNGVSTTTDGSCPSCTAGAWATSTATTDDTEVTVTYTTQDNDAESNNWYAYACDNVSNDQKCSAVSQGTGGTDSDQYSPFKVNHRPSFTAYQNSSPSDPGATVTWTTTASDSDIDTATDTITLYVCKADDFTTTSGCGAGGEWCHSSAVDNNPSCSYALPVPDQDKDYPAYGFIMDNHHFAASGSPQGTDSTLTVNDVAPTIAPSSINLLNTDGSSGDLILTNPQGETSGFKVTFTVTDNNGCENASSGDEVSSVIANVYRSGIGQANCQASTDYDANDCYPAAYSSWNLVCSQDSGTCNGANDTDANWTCTFPLEYHADPTDVGSQYPDQNWLTSVQATDDNSVQSSLTESATGNELDQFMAYDVNESSIAYGNVGAGDISSQATTTVKATGNVGLDEKLSGTNMTSGANSISVGQQHYATTTGFSYGDGTTLTSSSTEYELNCKKTTVTDTPASKDTYWLLEIPSDTPAGTYTGTTTIGGVTGESTEW